MTKIALAVHGGASEEHPFFKKNQLGYQEGLREAVQIGYEALKKGRSALYAVEKSVMYLEDNPLFNAGRGSALNNKGIVEMDASIMDGRTLKAGAVSIVQNVKNPISLARMVMSKTRHILLAGYGALELAKEKDIVLKTPNYFLTEYQYEDFLMQNKKISKDILLKQKIHGTVGAVAVDKKGNIAAGTSTGGTSNKLPGRIGDSCIIGAGCYANNLTCAISGTGIGECLIRGVIAHTISSVMEFKKYSLKKACDYVIRIRNPKAHIGVIGVDARGNLCISFNTTVMKCAWISSGQKKISVRIYRNEFE